YHKKELQAHDDGFKELGKSATKDDLAKYKAVRARLAKNYEEAERKFKVAKAELAAEKAKCKNSGSAPKKKRG
ncbi:MAG: hypothetical protein Q8K51_01595, partial [Nitrospirota bacterium]|nr:hypothetical protein [Nitrospirota bacterium]